MSKNESSTVPTVSNNQAVVQCWSRAWPWVANETMAVKSPPAVSGSACFKRTAFANGESGLLGWVWDFWLAISTENNEDHKITQTPYFGRFLSDFRRLNLSASSFVFGTTPRATSANTTSHNNPLIRKNKKPAIPMAFRDSMLDKYNANVRIVSRLWSLSHKSASRSCFFASY